MQRSQPGSRLAKLGALPLGLAFLLGGMTSCGSRSGLRVATYEPSSANGGPDAGLVPPDSGARGGTDAPTADAPTPCLAGAALVTLSTLAAPNDMRSLIALDDTFVYAVYPGQVPFGSDALVRVPKCGGATVTLASNQSRIEGLATDSTSVLWANAQDSSSSSAEGTVLAMPTGGGPTATVAASGGLNPTSLAVDPGPGGLADIYWTDSYSASIQRRPKGGGVITTFATRQDNPANLAVSATHLCWTTYVNGVTGESSLVCADRAGAAPYVVASSTTLGYGFTTLDSTSVYATAGDGSGAADILRLPLAGGPAVTLASGFPTGLAVDATDVYWTDSVGAGGTAGTPGNASVRRVPITGGAVTTLASSRSFTDGVAVDATRVYWLENPSGVGPFIVTAPK